MDMLIRAIRQLKRDGRTAAYVNENEEEIKMILEVSGFNGSDNDFFESVKKAMVLCE